MTRPGLRIRGLSRVNLAALFVGLAGMLAVTLPLCHATMGDMSVTDHVAAVHVPAEHGGQAPLVCTGTAHSLGACGVEPQHQPSAPGDADGALVACAMLLLVVMVTAIRLVLPPLVGRAAPASASVSRSYFDLVVGLRHNLDQLCVLRT